jgi:protoporphyrinogen oxidase
VIDPGSLNIYSWKKIISKELMKEKTVQTRKDQSWGIIGGGIMGMTLALRLAQQGVHVTVFESAERPGGLTRSWEMEGIEWDRFYHVILLSDLSTRKMLDEIGLGNQCTWVETKTGFYSAGKLYSMSNLVEFFRFPPINLLDKFRLGFTIFLASRIRNWEKLEAVPVENWLTRWSGKRVFDKIWLPLLKAKLGENYKITSAAFIWATIQRMYAARKTGLKKEMFGYVRGGYGKINRHFAAHLERQGVVFRTGCQVASVTSETNGTPKLTLTSGESHSFSRIISTLPSHQSVAIAGSLSQVEKDAHNAVRYLGVVCPSLMLRKPLSPYYVTNITEHWTPFTGIIEMTALVDKDKELSGKHLVYLPKYVNPDDPLFDQSDEAIRKQFLDPLFRMYPFLQEDDILFFGVSKARNVFALPTIGYSGKLPGIHTSVPGFYMINSAQIINGTLNVNETIQVAESKLKIILDEICKEE